MSLIQAMRLDVDDVYQDFCVAAMNAIDTFDEKRSDSLKTHVATKLMYEAKNLKRKYRPYGFTGTIDGSAIYCSLDNARDGYGQLEVPVEAPYVNVEMRELLAMLSLDELRVLQEALDGVYHRKKEQKELITGIKEKAKWYMDLAAISWLILLNILS